MRVNQGQEFVIGVYTLSPKNFGALIFSYHEGGKLMYAGRTRNGFTPAAREQLFEKFHGVETLACPFPAGETGGALGPGAYGREDGGMPPAAAGAGRTIRCRGVDSGRLSPSFTFLRAPGGRRMPVSAGWGPAWARRLIEGQVRGGQPALGRKQEAALSFPQHEVEMQQSGRLENDGGTENACRAQEKGARAGNGTISRVQLGSTLATAIEDQQLMPDQHGFGDNGTESAWLRQSRHGDDQMNE